MPEFKPIMGFPSRKAAAKALRARNFTDREIANMLGTSPRQVYNLIRDDRRAIYFPKDVLEQLEDAAKRRGILVTALVVKIVTAVSDDGLVDAILDDVDAAT